MGRFLFQWREACQQYLAACRWPDGFVCSQTPFVEWVAQFSPDGRFVAYCSNESGQYEVQVQPFPEGRGKWQVSTSGGGQPRWSKDGKELFYVEGDMLIAVAVRTTPSFSSGEI